MGRKTGPLGPVKPRSIAIPDALWDALVAEAIEEEITAAALLRRLLQKRYAAAAIEEINRRHQAALDAVQS